MFFSEAGLEAAGVMWQEVCELKNAVTLNHVIEFKWRPETMKSFFDGSGQCHEFVLSQDHSGECRRGFRLG